jgi:HlyD family secretion protein
MELLPLNEPLIIEARVRPQDIDSVKHGQDAMVWLTALSQRVTPMVSGQVIYLSADTVADEKKSLQTGPTDIYVIRVRLNIAEVAAVSIRRQACRRKFSSRLPNEHSSSTS